MKQHYIPVEDNDKRDSSTVERDIKCYWKYPEKEFSETGVSSWSK
jgi:hypothetical protein